MNLSRSYFPMIRMIEMIQANVTNYANAAFGISRMAYATAVKDKIVMRIGQPAFRYARYQSRFGLLGGFFVTQADPV